MDLEAAKLGSDIAARYRARYGRQDRIFKSFDRILGLFIWRKAQQLPRPMPRRILLVNAGHLGDIIMSTGLLPVLHHAFPGVEVGFLIGTYSRLIVDGHPLVARIHFFDHWYQSRKVAPLWRKFAQSLWALPKVVRELRAAQYDIAIDLRSWFPNLIPILWLARIPTRVGYDRLGFTPLLTHPIRYAYRRRPEFEFQLDLLRALGISETSIAKGWPTLVPTSSQAVQEARALVGNIPRYRVLHPMASTSTRDWKPEHWEELAKQLLANGAVPIITGSGPREHAMAETICRAAPGSINAVDQLSWAGLLAVIEGAEAVYVVETSIGHVASALRRPVISIYGGMADPIQWAPLGAAVTTNVVPCHPCLRKTACADRECLLGITVQDVQAVAPPL